jgi:serine carboxypeptidase-like clade 1
LANPLFVSGESYGGVYVPYLAWQVYQHNLAAEMKNETQFNIKGIMVGNGATDWDFDVSPSFPTTVFNFNLIP